MTNFFLKLLIGTSATNSLTALCKSYRVSRHVFIRNHRVILFWRWLWQCCCNKFAEIHRHDGKLFYFRTCALQSERETFLQQNKRTFHIAEISINNVNCLFTNHVISWKGVIVWLFRSLNLTIFVGLSKKKQSLWTIEHWKIEFDRK